MEINNEGGPKMEMQEIAHNNFDLWAKALLTKDPKKVAELYSQDSTFHPTVSGKFKKGSFGAEEYFEHFLAKNPEGKITEEKVHSLGSDSYLHSGLYDFEVDNSEGRENVNARFSFVWRKDPSGQWKIIHHHSSVKPQ